MFPFIGLTPEETALLHADPKQFFADNPELELKIYEVARNKVFNLPDIQALLDAQVQVLMGDLEAMMQKEPKDSSGPVPNKEE